MRDKRPVDELSVEELERVLAIRRREDRQKRLTRMKAAGRVIETQHQKSVAASQSSVPVSNDANDVSGIGAVSTPAASATPSSMAIPAGGITLEALDAILERKDAGTPSSKVENPAAASVQHNRSTAQPVSSTAVLVEDDLDDDLPVEPQAASGSQLGRRMMNGVLLLVEIAAVAGLIFLGVNVYTEVAKLQKESADVQALADKQRREGIPTPAPTSVIEVFKLDDYLLPGGHKIDEKGNVAFNFDELLAAEVPDHLQASAIAQAFAIDFVRPEKTTETALQVFIPKLNIDATIVQGSDWEALKLGVGQVINGANPGDQDGNVALAAHDDVFGSLFASISDLEVGDDIQIQTITQTYTYHVTASEIVRPTDVHVLENQGQPMVTLITCYPPGVNDRRYIVYAVREDAFRKQES